MNIFNSYISLKDLEYFKYKQQNKNQLYIEEMLKFSLVLSYYNNLSLWKFNLFHSNSSIVI